MPTTIERRARSVSRKRAVPGSTAFAALAGVLVLALSFAPAAGATIVNYGSFAGTDVQFVNVSEASNDPPPLFGPKAEGLHSVGERADSLFNLLLHPFQGPRCFGQKYRLTERQVVMIKG